MTPTNQPPDTIELGPLPAALDNNALLQLQAAEPATASTPPQTATHEATDQQREIRRLHAVDQPEESATLVDQVAQAMAAGRPVTAALIAEIEGVSERTSRGGPLELQWPSQRSKLLAVAHR